VLNERSKVLAACSKATVKHKTAPQKAHCSTAQPVMLLRIKPGACWKAETEVLLSGRNQERTSAEHSRLQHAWPMAFQMPHVFENFGKGK